MERVVAALRHRGPDGIAVDVTEGATLGHARLAILDPRPEGGQPMWNDRKTVVIVFNGEIFNYRQLKEKFGLQCKTGTDTEVLLHLYDREGIGFVKRLIGMFAFGLYDVEKRTWYVVRDPSGIKPLYVSFPNNELHFASEMRALMAALPEKPNIDLTSLSRYLHLQYVPGPKTLCEGIESLAPGTILIWKDGMTQREALTTPVETPRYRSRSEFREQFPALMDTCVRDHLVSDRPIGIYVSGGMDSSIILHHMANHVSGPVKTFTVRFEATEQEGAARFNTDADLAKRTARHYGTDHTEVLLTAEGFRDLYRDTARALDQPNADTVSPAQVLLSQHAKKSADVVLTGAGGDELFGGYPRYRIAHILHRLRMLPPSVRAAAGRLSGHPADVLRLQPGPDLALRLLSRPEEEVKRIVRGGWYDPRATPSLFAGRFESLNATDPVRAFMEFDRGLWLVDESLRLTDATTMASGVEGRVPFLDPRVIAAAHATPSDWHVGLRHTKTLLKDTYRNILPDHLFTLKKASFYPPLAKWLRREAGPLVEEALEQPRIREYLDTDVIAQLYQEHRGRRGYHLHVLQGVIQLAAWFDTVYDAHP